MLDKIVKLANVDSESREVLFAASGILFIRIFALALSFLMSILIARFLGVTEYGVYAYAYSVATLIALVALLGLDRYSMRETAIAYQHKDWSAILGLKKPAEYYIVISSIVLVSLTILFYTKLNFIDTKQIHEALPFIIFLTPFIALLRLEAGILRGLKKVARSQVPDNILRPLFLIVILVFLDSSTIEPKGSSIIISHGIACLLAFTWIYLDLTRTLPASFNKTVPNFQISYQFKSSLSLGGIAILGGFANQIPLLFMGAHSTPEELGSFAAAMRLAQLTTFTYAAMNMALGPTMARIYKTGDKQRMSEISQLTAFISLVLSLPIAAVFVFFSAEILSLYGEGFSQAHQALEILVILQLIHVSVGSVALWLMMSKRENLALLAQVMSFLVTLILSFYLIPQYDSSGAAISYAAGLILYNLICAGFVMIVLGFNPTSYGFISKLLSKVSSK